MASTNDPSLGKNLKTLCPQ